MFIDSPGGIADRGYELIIRAPHMNSGTRGPGTLEIRMLPSGGRLSATPSSSLACAIPCIASV